MPYPALPDHRIPYDNDGTIVYKGSTTGGATTLCSGAELLALQNISTGDGLSPNVDVRNAGVTEMFYFFPEQREITGIFVALKTGEGDLTGFQGSNDTTNGADGTWETASLPGGAPAGFFTFDAWRSGIKPVSFTGPKKNLRFYNNGASGSGSSNWSTVHLYGEAAAGQMAHDLVFINHDDTPGVAFTTPEDFGDQPLGTTVVRQFRIKNTSATKTATNVNIQCNDTDFVISEDGVNWVVTIVIPSLGPGVESNTLFVRCTTPAPGAPLAPRFARMVAIADAGFFG